MKILLSLFSVLILSIALWAQGECPCEQTIPLTDATCTSPFDCTAPSGGCQSTTFTASCTGHYTLSVSISCSSGSCGDYNVCAMLYDSGGGFLGHCFDVGDNCSPCYGSCQTACLYSGHQYTLYVCLQSCGDDACPSTVTCTANGLVKYCGNYSITCQ